MLFVLSGNVQTGKTRWLERLVGELRARGCMACGVLAPGAWADRRNDAEPSAYVDANGFEKLGIDNVLLPEGVRIKFARRADLALREGAFDNNAQSAQAKLSWHISEEALERVNEHFANLASRFGRATEMPRECERGSLPETTPPPCADDALKGFAPRGDGPSGILIVDELGRLELLRGGGLTGALAVLENGPTPQLPHALIVVRVSLLPQLEGRFGLWGERVVIGPDETSAALVINAVMPTPL